MAANRTELSESRSSVSRTDGPPASRVSRRIDNPARSRGGARLGQHHRGIDRAAASQPLASRLGDKGVSVGHLAPKQLGCRRIGDARMASRPTHLGRLTGSSPAAAKSVIFFMSRIAGARTSGGASPCATTCKSRSSPTFASAEIAAAHAARTVALGQPLKKRSPLTGVGGQLPRGLLAQGAMHRANRVPTGRVGRTASSGPGA